MKRLRYFTETLPLDKTLPSPGEQLHHESQKSAIHQNARSYHWVRVDDNIIYGYAELDEHHFNNLVNGHPTVSIHPSVHEKTKIKDHLNKHKKDTHFSSLQQLVGADLNDTTIDVVAKMVGKGHTFLSPEK